MADENKRTELISRVSKALVQDKGLAGGFFSNQNSNKNDFAIEPDANLHRVLNVVQNDSVVRGAVTTLVDRTLEPGFSFYGKDKRSRKQNAIDKMDDLRFSILMRGLLNNLYTYSNVFIEIVKKGNEPYELHLIDPRYTEPHIDKHGQILRYVMKSGEEVVTWSPEEVVHIKTTPLGNTFWGDIDIKALWVACALKYHIKKLFLWQFETNQFRPVLSIKEGASDEQLERFLSFLKQAQSDIKKLIPIEGELEAVFLNKEWDYSKVKELITYLDFEILSLLQVPPIAVGLPDNANRSNSDAQERALNTRIKSIHRLLEDVISKDLLPRLGFDKVTMKFNTIDDKTLQTSLDVAEKMRNMGFKEELIKEFLEAKGWDFPEGDIFDPEKEVIKSQDMMPSRQGKPPGQGNKQIGTGEQGTTRENQLVSRTLPSFMKYGTIEYEVDE